MRRRTSELNASGFVVRRWFVCLDGIRPFEFDGSTARDKPSGMGADVEQQRSGIGPS
jgi:hypothetical protein